MSEIILSPFSNNALRDWPLGHYAGLARLLLDRTDPACTIAIIGTRGHRAAAAGIVRDLPTERAINLCGRIAWTDVIARVRRAACVVGNNSGVVHLSRHFGVRTVCVFGGSHQRTEWGPLGPSAITVSREIACSPCQRNHIWECPYGVACLRDIDPAQVADAVMAALALPERRGMAAVNTPAERIAGSC